MNDRTGRDGAPMRVDIVSDVVCPWCIVGYRQLEEASRQAGIPIAVHWHPFELNPQMGEEGENLREHLMAKYGISAEDSVRSRARLTRLGDEVGFTFRYSDGMRMVNTFRAHQLLHWADTQGRQHDLKLSLFAAFFTEGLDVNDPEVLAERAASVGLEADAARAVLADGRLRETVRAEQAEWLDRGVTGVPAMVLDGRYMVPGAQGVETYVLILQRLRDRPAA